MDMGLHSLERLFTLGLFAVSGFVVLGSLFWATRRNREREDALGLLHKVAELHGVPPTALRFDARGGTHVELPDPFADPSAEPQQPSARKPPPRIAVRSEGLGTLVTVTATFRSVPLRLALRPELVGEWFDKAVGTTVDHRVGDPAFDRVFVIESAPPDLAAKVLSPEVRELLLALPRRDDRPRLALSHDGQYTTMTLEWRGVRAAGPPVIAVLDALRQLGTACMALREGADVAAATPFRDAGSETAVDPLQRNRALRALAGARWRFAALLLALVAGVAGGVAYMLPFVRLRF